MEADLHPLDESIMEVDGASFMASTMTEEEHNAECNEYPKSEISTNHLNENIFSHKSFVAQKDS